MNTSLAIVIVVVIAVLGLGYIVGKLVSLRSGMLRAADEAADLFKEIRTFVPELRRTNQRLQNLIGGDLPPPAAPGGVTPIGFVTSAAQPPAMPKPTTTTSKVWSMIG